MSVIDVEQTFYLVTKYEKKNTLKKLIEVNDDKRVLVFVEKKRHADFLAVLLSEQQLPTSSIHGARVRRDRLRALKNFESGRHRVLVATKVDLDIKNVDIVINYDLPNTIDEYMQRIGRTGRGGKTGQAISFFDADQNADLVEDLAEFLLHADQSIPHFLQSGSGDKQKFNNAFVSSSGGYESGEDW